MTDDEDSLFDQALLRAGNGNRVMESNDVLNGWRMYRDEYHTNPDVIRCTRGAVYDMIMDSVLRDMIVTQETVFMTPSVDPERNLELFEERTSDDAFGLLMGMEIVIDDEFDNTEALLYERERGITERSVLVTG